MEPFEDRLNIRLSPSNVGLDCLNGVLESVHGDAEIRRATNKILYASQITLLVESTRTARDKIGQCERRRAVSFDKLVPVLFHVVVGKSAADRVGGDRADVRDAVLFANE